MDTTLETIAKTILLNASFEKNTGLYSGKMGAAIFLYYYERYNTNPVYLDLADELVMETTENLSRSDAFYINGLAGIGWGIRHLMRNGFIDDSDDEDIFSTMNRAILNRGMLSGRDTEVYGVASYILSVLPATAPDTIDDEIDWSIMQEKVIFVIDEISHFHNDLSKFLESEEVFLKSWNDRQLDFATLIKLYTQATMVVIKAYHRHLYPSIVTNLLSQIHAHLRQIARCIRAIIENHYSALRLKDDRLHLAYLVSVNAWSQLTRCLGYPDEAPLLVAPLHIPATAITDNTSALAKITTHACVNRIASSPEYIIPENIKMASFVYEDNHLNLGVGGLAGIGLSLLGRLHPEISGWDEAILLS